MNSICWSCDSIWCLIFKRLTLGDFSLDLWSRTTNNLEELSKSNMLQDHIWKLLQEHVCYMLLEQYVLKIWPWNIINLEYSSRLLMVQDHMVLKVQGYMVLDNKSRPKSPKSRTGIVTKAFFPARLKACFYHQMAAANCVIILCGKFSGKNTTLSWGWGRVRCQSKGKKVFDFLM